MATDYKIVVVPDTGGTRPCIECPQCLGLQLLYTCIMNMYLLVRTYVGYHFVHGNVDLVHDHLHVFACCVEKSPDNQSRPSWFEFLHSSRKKNTQLKR